MEELTKFYKQILLLLKLKNKSVILLEGFSKFSCESHTSLWHSQRMKN